ncbi:hypothetical protein B0H10DRAFT_1957424 [Mycena sp. CBHHK59/15]|nr:hypothetical protein B0H10DRAFT_1957424 [Mycena sp. CBHHK59/15]
MNNHPTRTFIRQLKLTSWQEGPEDQDCMDWHCGHGLSGCDLCLGSGGLRSWTEAATSVWASGGVGVVAWQAATSVWASGGIWVVAWQAATSVWVLGLDIVAWQAATSIWVLGEQIEIGLASHNFFLASRGCFGPMVTGQPGQLSCLCRGFIAGNNLPNCLRDGVLGWLWAVWPT